MIPFSSIISVFHIRSYPISHFMSSTPFMCCWPSFKHTRFAMWCTIFRVLHSIARWVTVVLLGAYVFFPNLGIRLIGFKIIFSLPKIIIIFHCGSLKGCFMTIKFFFHSNWFGNCWRLLLLIDLSLWICCLILSFFLKLLFIYLA